MAYALDFNPDTHVYSLRGQRLESVTQVLEDVGISNYLSLPPDVREEALHRGRVVHEAICLDIEGDLDDGSVPVPYIGYVLAARQFRQDSKLQVEKCEHRAYHAVHKYAGTLDFKGLADLGSGVRRYLGDWKTGQMPYWVRYQLAAYASFFPAPGAELRICVELHADATYRVEEFSPADYRADMDVFLSALTVMRTKELGRYEH